MRRIVVPDIALDADRARLGAAAARHVGRVLRLGPGDELLVGDGRGGLAHAVIEAIGSDDVVVRIGHRDDVTAAIEPPLHLVQGLTKGGGKMDEVVRRATELGVAGIHPALCERSVARPGRERARSRLDRWRTIAAEASRQCGRDRLPDVADLAPLDVVLARLAGVAPGIVLWEHERTASLATRLGGLDLEGGLVLVIGPEGGLAAGEVEAARSLGFVTASMGPLVLRTETAAIAACALARFFLGGLEPAT
jgi:16S rRNA (uracil1498-N3)-methyltransferase